MNYSTKAVVATVDLGFTEIQGLMLPDGSYAVAISQLAELLSLFKGNASRDFKALLGKNFSLIKVKSEINSQPVNIVTISQATKIIYQMSLKGDKVARELMLALVDEGLDRRFSRAFGKRIDEDEYQQRLTLRMQRILARKLWTDILRDRSLDLYGVKPTSQQYKEWTVIVNNRLFNRDHFNCDRDNMSQEEQEYITLFEKMAERKAKLHGKATPDELVEMALAAFE